MNDMATDDMLTVKRCKCGREKQHDHDPFCAKCWCEWAEQKSISAGFDNDGLGDDE